MVALPDDELGARLRAAVVLEGDAPISSSELASHCATKLPPYAVPESFVQLSELPTTSTGKVDRQTLAETMKQPQSPIPPEGRARVS